MKTLTEYCCLLLCCAVVASTAFGQSPQSTPPPLAPGPLIQKRAPEFAEWVVSAKYSQKIEDPTKNQSSQSSNNQPKTNLRQLDVTKTGDVLRIERTDEMGRTWESWCKGSLQVIVWPGTKNCEIVTPPTNPDMYNPLYVDFAGTDFPGFSWLSLANYTSQETFMGHQCIVFKDAIQFKSDDPAIAAQRTPVAAYVDLESRLPLALMRDEQVYIYEWKNAPTSPLTYPANVQSFLENRVKGLRRMSQAAMKPF